MRRALVSLVALSGFGLAISAGLVMLAGTARAAGAPPRLAVRAAALYVPTTGQTLDATAAQRELPIASTTKLMTALVVLQHVRDLDDVFAFPDYDTAPGDSQIGLHPGDRMTVHDLLVAMMLPSADDAAEDLAWNVGHGSVARFVAMMNAEARRLGLRRTHYATPIGLDTPGNYSTAHDLVRLADYDLAHEPELARIVALRRARLATGPEREVVNLNGLLAAHSWIDGVKTGHTAGAGYVLVASGQRHGMRLISAVLGTDSEATRDADSLALLDYGFDDFRLRRPIVGREVLAHLGVSGHGRPRVAIRAARGFVRVLPRHERVGVRLDLPERVTGPLPAGAIVGTATVIAAGRPLARIPLVLTTQLTAVSRLTSAGHSLAHGWVLATIAVLLGLACAGVVARAGRPFVSLRVQGRTRRRR